MGGGGGIIDKSLIISGTKNRRDFIYLEKRFVQGGTPLMGVILL